MERSGMQPMIKWIAVTVALALPASALAAPEPYSTPCYRPAHLHLPDLVCYERQPPVVCDQQCHSWPHPRRDEAT